MYINKYIIYKSNLPGVNEGHQISRVASPGGEV